MKDWNQITAKLSIWLRRNENQTIQNWLEEMLEHLIPEVHGLQAAIFLRTNNCSSIFQYSAGYALESIPQPIREGIGISGQVIKSRKYKLIETQNSFTSVVSTGVCG
ncbi:MAG: hypothetical protein NZ108_09190, partial [Bacteroidia bacterium]|nr:hypothetical protein [Bacteroidia bacterium]